MSEANEEFDIQDHAQMLASSMVTGYTKYSPRGHQKRLFFGKVFFVCTALDFTWDGRFTEKSFGSLRRKRLGEGQGRIGLGDAQELVVLSHAVTAAEAAGLYLSGACANGQVSNKGIFCLAAAV